MDVFAIDLSKVPVELLEKGNSLLLFSKGPPPALPGGTQSREGWRVHIVFTEMRL